MHDLFKYLFKFFLEEKEIIETNVNDKRIIFKNEIDLRVESLKVELDQLRDDLFLVVDQICDNDLKK
jgi:hypothetical protein